MGPIYCLFRWHLFSKILSQASLCYHLLKLQFSELIIIYLYNWTPDYNHRSKQDYWSRLTRMWEAAQWWSRFVTVIDCTLMTSSRNGFCLEMINIGSVYFLLGCWKPTGKRSKNLCMTISVGCLVIWRFKNRCLSQVLAKLIYNFIYPSDLWISESWYWLLSLGNLR